MAQPPDNFDPNDFAQLVALVECLKSNGVRNFVHPSGLSLTFDTKREQAMPAFDGGEA